MKRKISAFHLAILKKELLYLEEMGELSPNQAEKLLQHYEIADRQVGEKPGQYNLNFIQVISISGRFKSIQLDVSDFTSALCCQSLY